MIKLFTKHLFRNQRLIVLSIVFFATLSLHAQNIEFTQATKLPPTINSGGEESLPLLSPDKKTLYFVRSLNAKNTRGKMGGQDIWYSTRDDKNSWSEATNQINYLNTKGNNAVIGFNSDGTRVYLLNTYKKGIAFSKGVSYSDLINGAWSKPKIINLKNFDPKSLFYGFYMHPSENFLLVSMDGEESVGHEDLYVILKDAAGEWGAPIHLGSTINTKGYEISPFLSQDGTTLYFSSNGHEGLGSADIYMAKRLYNSWNIWTKPVNLGENINSASFDAYFSIADDSTAYFASSRRGDWTDIYQSKLFTRNIKQILDMEDTPSPTSSITTDKKAVVSEEETNKFLGVSIPRIVYFDLNSATISPEDKELIFYIASKIEKDKKYNLQIIGHSDREGNDQYNMELSLKRADAVKEYFSTLGISKYRMSIIGKGASQPAITANPQDKKNRRVEINFLK